MGARLGVTGLVALVSEDLERGIIAAAKAEGAGELLCPSLRLRAKIRL